MVRLLLTIFCAAACLAALPAARAAALANVTGGAAELRRFVEGQVAGGLAGHARIEIALGELNARLQLAPCTRIEPFVPANTRLWGRSSLGLRCVQGAAWSVQMPVTVRVFGPALVAARPMAANTPLSEADFAINEVEWTREPHGVAIDAAQIDNRVLTRPIATGQPVPLAALRAPQVIAAGDPVKLLGEGRGFAITAQAVALASAQDGQPVRVRTDSGRILTGTARSGRRVEVAF